MPVYEYQCTQCGEVIEIFHKVDYSYTGRCPNCKGEVKRILSPSNFILKGSGFYVNDYPSESRKKTESSEIPPKKKGPAKEKKVEKAA